MLAHILETYGLRPNEFQMVKEICSAFSRRAGLERLLSAVLSGGVKTVISEHADRLARGSDMKLIEFICESHGTEIIFVKQTIEDESDSVYMARELIDYVTVICNRISSRKSAALSKVTLHPEAMARALDLRATGHSLFRTFQLLGAEGFCNPRTKKPYARATIKKNLEEHSQRELAEMAVNGGIPTDHHSGSRVELVRQYLEEMCVFKPEAWILAKQLYSGFLDFCEANEVHKPYLTRIAFSKRVQAQPEGFKRGTTSSNHGTFKGLEVAAELPKSS